MIPALQTLLAVDCVDPTAMFNRNAGSDELRYMRQVPAYLTSLEYSYFYHLCILILVLSDVHWNMFDIGVWVTGYICVGMLRKTLHVLNVERDYSINDYAYNCSMVGLLRWSRVAGWCLGGLGMTWVLWVHASFLGVPMKYISLLCFPAFLLILDSIFMILISRKTK